MAFVIERVKGALSSSFLARQFTRIDIHGLVNDETSAAVVKQLQQSVNLNCVDECGSKIIFIFIHSRGGSVYEAFRIIEAINHAKRYCTVATVIDSIAFSVAVPIFCCGDEGFRFVSPDAQIMIHQAVMHRSMTRQPSENKQNSKDKEQKEEKGWQRPKEETKKEQVQEKQSEHADLVQTQLDHVHVQRLQQRLERIMTAIYQKNKKLLIDKFLQDLGDHRGLDWHLSAKDLIDYGLADHAEVPDFLHDFEYRPAIVLRGKVLAVPKKQPFLLA